MKNSSKSNIIEIKKCYKDNFHAFMVKNADYDGFYDMPIINQKEIKEISFLVSYDETYNHIYKSGEVVHFYIDDYKFDGPKGIWQGFSNDKKYKRGFDISRFYGAEAIISPDFSLYMDMPRAMQIWNVYRSRAVGSYLSSLGFNIIPNIRWTDEKSYEYCFKGIEKNQVVSVGTLGCSKNKVDKNLFNLGFIEMIKRLKPSKVIIYGSITNELRNIIIKYNVNIIHFFSKTQLFFYEEKTNGNERK